MGFCLDTQALDCVHVQWIVPLKYGTQRPCLARIHIVGMHQDRGSNQCAFQETTKELYQLDWTKELLYGQVQAAAIRHLQSKWKMVKK